MTPTSGEVPCNVASPSAAAGSTTSPQVSPASTRALRFSASIWTPRISLVLSSSVSSRERGRGLWPVLWGATRRPFSAAKATTEITSCTSAGWTTAAGRWSTARLKPWRAASQSASCALETRPERLVASASIWSAPCIRGRILGEEGRIAESRKRPATLVSEANQIVRNKADTRTTGSGPDLELAARLRLAIARTARRLRQEAGTDLGPAQTSALATIERHGPLTPSELAERERIKRPTATRSCARSRRPGWWTAFPTPTTAAARSSAPAPRVARCCGGCASARPPIWPSAARP